MAFQRLVNTVVDRAHLLTIKSLQNHTRKDTALSSSQLIEFNRMQLQKWQCNPKFEQLDMIFSSPGEDLPHRSGQCFLTHAWTLITNNFTLIYRQPLSLSLLRIHLTHSISRVIIIDAPSEGEGQDAVDIAS